MASLKEVDDLISEYKKQFPEHYNIMSALMGIEDKTKLKNRNGHLISTNYYDRMLFYQYLQQNRMKNSLCCVAWAMICTASLCSQGIGNQALYRGKIWVF